MTPIKHNLKIRRGADWHRIFSHRSAATGVPFDLTGCTARMQIRSELGSSVVLDSLTTENGRLVLVNRVNPLGGFVLAGIDMIFPSAVTSACTWDEGVYDLEIVRSSGLVDCMIETSKIVLTGEVTR